MTHPTAPEPGQASYRPGGSVLVAIALLIGGTWAFSFIDALAKLLARDLPVIEILWGRLCVFVVIFAFFVAPWRWPGLLVSPRVGLQIFRALIPIVASWLAYVALKTMSLADMTAITFASPFFLTALSVVLLGERVGVHRWTALVIGFTGVLVIIRPGAGVFDWVAVLPVGAAFLYAIFQVTTRMLTEKAGPETVMLYTGLVGVAATTPFAVAYWQTPTLAQWGLIVASGVGHITAHILFVMAFSRAEAAQLSPFNYVKIVAALFLGYVLFSEIPDAVSIAGMTIVIASGLYVVHRERAAVRD
ncbi:MAG: DMT family transporter [Alphaproteobacteria bacterium]|nr:DMT family transporter [Alphaproteobacteria bacterium]